MPETRRTYPILDNGLRILSLLCICIAGIIGIVCFKASPAVLLVTGAFMLFYVLLPGSWLLSLLRAKNGHLSDDLSRGFFVGFAANVILYFISDLIGTDLLLYAAGPLMSAAWLVRLLKDKPKDACRSFALRAWSAPASFYLFAACVFLYSIAATQYTYISPAHCDFSSIKIDFGFHAGIINALAAGYPPQDPWVSGAVIEYHFFVEMLYAIPARLFHLPSDEILMSSTAYVITPALSLSMYSFFRAFSSRKDRAGLYCLITHFSNVFMLKAFTKSWLFYHLYSNINNAGMGIACMLTALPLLKSMDHRETGKGASAIGPEILLFSILVTLDTGIKGPIALILVGGMAGTLILAVILGKANKRVFAATGLSIILFGIIYVVILGAQHENETGGKLINLWEISDIFFLKPELMELTEGSRALQGVVLLGAMMVFLFTAFLIPFFVGYARELILVLSGKKEFVFSRVVIYAAALVGLICMLVLDFAGHSQVYFGFVTFILVPIISFWYFEDAEESHVKGAGFVRAVFIAMLCVAAVTTALSMYGEVSDGVQKYAERNENKSKYKNVSAAEYEGLIWLRENTEKDALISSDRYYSCPKDEYILDSRGTNSHFGYAIYSNRRQYIEGSAFTFVADDVYKLRDMVHNNEDMHDAANSERGDLARSLGVDYIVVSLRFEDPGDLSNEDYEESFRNEEMIIYKVKK